jgi:biotin carboxyl carrier protein
MRNSVKTLVTVNKLLVMAFFALILPFQQLSAQVKRPANKPAAAKPAAKKPAAAKPAANKPAAAKPAANRPEANKPAANRPSGNKSDAKNIGGKDGRADIPGNKTNNVNIDNSKKNVNINVDKSKDIHVNNSHNTTVRRNTRVYSRPPYVYGGRRYRCYHPYYFHPYRPFVWGPMWHPWGFFIATLATTAIIVSIVDNDVPSHADMASNDFTGIGLNPLEKQLLLSGPAFVSYSDNPVFVFNRTTRTPLTADGDYYYDQGVFYLKGNGGYTVVAAPVGAKIKTLPSGYETVKVDEKTTNYYYGGTFYEKRSDGYVVVAPMAGSVVEHISEGGEEVKLGDQTYVKFGETYFQPIQLDGKNVYEVADVEEDK